MNAIGAEDGKAAAGIAAEVDHSADAFSGTGQGDFVGRTAAGAMLILDPHPAAICHRAGQSQIGE